MFQKGFPAHLGEDVLKVVRLIANQPFYNVTKGMSQEFIHYYQCDHAIQFPNRIYYVERSNKETANLSQPQKMILHCIYSRSNDGFVRQKHLHALLQMDYEEWAIPYIVKVCDEYVIEILEMTYDMLKEQHTQRIRNFCLENKESFFISYNRMVSYWNEYYRHTYTDFDQYIGRKLFRECFGYSKSIEFM